MRRADWTREVALRMALRGCRGRGDTRACVADGCAGAPRAKRCFLCCFPVRALTVRVLSSLMTVTHVVPGLLAVVGGVATMGGLTGFVHRAFNGGKVCL